MMKRRKFTRRSCLIPMKIQILHSFPPLILGAFSGHEIVIRQDLYLHSGF